MRLPHVLQRNLEMLRKKRTKDGAPVIVPLQTYVNVIDSCIPIDREQRELILGDRLDDNIRLESLADVEQVLREAALDIPIRARKHIGRTENFDDEDKESILRLFPTGRAGFRPATLLKTKSADWKQDVPNPGDIGRDL
jgi:hypothetical protein